MSKKYGTSPSESKGSAGMKAQMNRQTAAAQNVQRSLVENALREIRQLRATVKANEDAKREPIAIIGIGCRFPGGANSPAAFWQLLANGVDAITPIPGDRWDVDAYYDGDRRTPGKMYTRQGGFIDHPYDFDAHFFGISPKEARSLDPQQRLLLELSWEALEEAGIVPETLVGSQTGVFVGISSNDYSQQLLTRPVSEIDAYLATGNSHSTAAGRLSFTLGLSGPSLALDTACSSSLVSVHIACQQLRDRSCDLALAGGVNRILSPEFTINFAKAQMLAEDGRCKTFDASADGFSRGEGGGMIVLKRLSDAIADGDEIWAVVRGSAINHDGRSSGLTVPNGPSQQRVIQQALNNSGLEPADISYVEAHGTGTSLGDPIELHALGQVFGESHSADHPLQVGSVKTNVGHLEAGAGIAGIIKVALALRYQQIPPHLHFQTPNPNVVWDKLPLAIPTELKQWQILGDENDGTVDHSAGVSSFGFSGTNAHVILGEFSSPVSNPDPRLLEEAGDLNPEPSDELDEHLLVLSAKTPQSLRDLAKGYWRYVAEILQTPPQPSLRLTDTLRENQGEGADPLVSPLSKGGLRGVESETQFLANLCFSAIQGRSHFDYRLAIATPDLHQCIQQLQSFIEQFDTSGFDPSNVERDDAEDERLQKQLNQQLNPLNIFYAQAAEAYITELGLNLADLYPPEHHQRIPLPTYPFQRQPYQFKRQPTPQLLNSPTPQLPNFHPLLGHPLRLSRSTSRYFEAAISLDGDTQFLQDHQVFGSIIFPGVAYIEMMLAAVAKCQANGNTTGNLVLENPIQLSKLKFQQPLQLSDDSTTIVQTVIEPKSESLSNPSSSDASIEGALGQRIEILSQQDFQTAIDAEEDEWKRHAIAHVTTANIEPPIADLASIRQRCEQSVDTDKVYELLSDRGIHYGPQFQAIQSIWRSEQMGVRLEGLGKIQYPTSLSLASNPYILHPALFDAALQVIGGVLHNHSALQNLTDVYLPMAVKTLTVFQPIAHKQALWSHVSVNATSLKVIAADIQVFADDSNVIAVLEGLQLRRMNPGQLAQSAPSELSSSESLLQDWLYEIEWRSQGSVAFTGINEALELASPTTIAAAVMPEFTSRFQQSDVVNYQALLPKLDQLSLVYMQKALDELGLSIPPSQVLTLPESERLELMSSLGIDPRYQSLFPHLCRCLTPPRESVSLLSKWGLTGIEQFQQQLSTQNPAATAELTLIKRCGQQLTKVLTGQTDPLQVLFPGGDTGDMTTLYERSPGAMVMNTLLKNAITQLTDLDSGRPLRILEIGAGTGGTTSHLLPLLDPDNTNYVFTDISPLFLKQAETIFADYEFVQYCTLDISQPTQAQAHPYATYDVVIAANVLHATPDIQETLSHVHQLLVPGGQLVLLEGTQQLCWIDLIFGLTEGWWQFNDAPLRQYHPLLSIEQWQAVLLDTGFASVTPLISDTDEVLPQTVFLAQVSAAVAPTPEQPGGKTASPVVLIYGQNEPLATEMLKRLAQNGDTCFTRASQRAIWLSYADGDSNAGEALADPSSEKQLQNSSKYQVNPESPTDVQQALKDIGEPIHSVLMLPDNAQTSDNSKRLDTIDETAIAHTEHLLNLVQALTLHQGSVRIENGVNVETASTVPQLFVVTEGAIQNPALPPLIPPYKGEKSGPPPYKGGVRGGGLAQSALWGLGKIISLEHPEYNCVRIDLDASDSAEVQGRSLWFEWQRQTEVLQNSASQSQALRREFDDQIVVRQGQRYVPRLVPHTASNPLDRIALDIPDGPFQLITTGKGTLENLTFAISERTAPQHHEVEIQVQAVGLNFIDVLDALGLLPFERGWFGVECAGKVVAVGSQVNGVAVGDRVMALAPSSFSRYVTTDAHLVAPVPDGMDMTSAASIPANFLTAFYALCVAAPLPELVQKGIATDSDAPRPPRVLIHGGASGTGMAAVAIAQSLGAEVFATASPSKWSVLEEMAVAHILPSRTLDFADRVMALTDGEGVDVVLNALSGEFIDKGVSVLIEAGYFLEMGKRDVWTEDQFHQVKPQGTYALIDLLSLAQTNPQQISDLFQGVLSWFEDGSLMPLPLSVFGAIATPQAFRTMQGGKHIGKLVVILDSVGWVEERNPTLNLDINTQSSNQRTPAKGTSLGYAVANPTYGSDGGNESTIRGDATYVITGGLGGLGLLTAQWLAKQGADHIVLVSRRNVVQGDVEQQLQALKDRGVQIEIMVADVSDRLQLTTVFDQLQQSWPLLRGIIHSAGVLDDGALMSLNRDRLSTVMAPKVQGAWNLHTLTQQYYQNEPLAFFVLFSSAASLLGSPGQGNHVAANAFLDALAHYRQSLGLPGLSINWGAWSDIGAASHQHVQEQMRSRGIGPIAPQQGIQILEQLLDKAIASQIGVIPIDWPQFLNAGFKSPFFSEFYDVTGQGAKRPESSATKVSKSELLQELERMAVGDRPTRMIAHLQAEVAYVLGGDTGQRLNARQGFFDMGMDSLMAVELRHRLEATTGIATPSTLIFEYPTIYDLAHYLVKNIWPESSSTPDSSEHLNRTDNRPPLAESSIIHPPDIPSKELNSDSLSPPSPILKSSANSPPRSPDDPEMEDAIAQELATLEALLGKT